VEEKESIVSVVSSPAGPAVQGLESRKEEYKLRNAVTAAVPFGYWVQGLVLRKEQGLRQAVGTK
jgi:hypothetical protein